MEGQIKKKPNYYGFWITPEGINSIFFMNIVEIKEGGEKEGEIGGDIEDRLGRAIIKGTKTKDKIIFDKVYMASSHPGASPYPLKYRGDKIRDSDNFYEGVYICDKDSDVFGQFILQPFPEDSPTMYSLYEDFHRKLFS